MFTENLSSKIKSEKNEKINLYSRCVACGFEIFETIDHEELSNFLKGLNYIKNNVPYCLKCKKNTESKNAKVVKKISEE